MNDMTKTEAFKRDRDFYVEYDVEYHEYGVFGDETGFCYLLSNEEDCNREARRLNRQKDKP